MKNAQQLLLFLVILCLTNCNTERKLRGLWQIERVSVGEQEMTPVAKWTRLNGDYSQQSGNGWLQHTVGSWAYDAKKQEIKFTSTNGVKDESGGFLVTRESKDRMLWKREEQGEEVQVFLKRIKRIPTSPANQLLGVWKLKATNGTEGSGTTTYLFFRWDQIVMQGVNDQKKYGVYKTHGHKKEVQFIYYEDPLRQEVWNYSFTDDGSLRLAGKTAGENVVLEYERIDYFPA